MAQDIIKDIQDLRYLNWTRIRQSSGTAGSFLKAYDVINGVKTYYKLSNYDSINGVTGHECVNELIVDRLLSTLAVDHLHYTLVHALINIDGHDQVTWLCSSMDFKQDGESKIAFDDFYELNRLQGESRLDFCSRYGWGDYFCTMLLVDFLVINRDRHGANIEILKDPRTGAYRPAPLFDHGLSFVCRCESKDQLSSFDPMQDTRVQSFLGTNSAFANLDLIPADRRPAVRPLQHRDRIVIMAGLDDVLPAAYLDKIWDIIWERWCYYENMSDN